MSEEHDEPGLPADVLDAIKEVNRMRGMNTSWEASLDGEIWRRVKGTWLPIGELSHKTVATTFANILTGKEEGKVIIVYVRDTSRPDEGYSMHSLTCSLVYQ